MGYILCNFCSFVYVSLNIPCLVWPMRDSCCSLDKLDLMHGTDMLQWFCQIWSAAKLGFAKQRTGGWCHKSSTLDARRGRRIRHFCGQIRIRTCRILELSSVGAIWTRNVITSTKNTNAKKTCTLVLAGPWRAWPVLRGPPVRAGPGPGPQNNLYSWCDYTIWCLKRISHKNQDE